MVINYLFGGITFEWWPTKMADNTTENNQPRQRGFGALCQHVSTHKLEMGLWATRLMTIIFTIAYFLPFFPAWMVGASPVAAYSKVNVCKLWAVLTVT